MDWRISKFAFLADFILVPIYVALATVGAWTFAEPTMQWYGFYAAGLVAWTFIEYWMHRVAFHRFYRAEHRLHHIRPSDWIGVSPFLTAAAFLLLWLALVQITNGIGRGGFAFVGFVTGYYIYITIHYMIHHTGTQIIARLRAAHESHHQGVDGNYGISTAFWDHVFRTYRVPAV
jgi:sterol desaturase/sphingolipid hydroxylase (fatty acid hydroxylase superfamily)